MLALPEDQRVISLDAEWDTLVNAAGHVISSERVAILQLGYRLKEQGQTRALILQLHKKKKLPERLAAFLADTTFKWTGRQLGGDLDKIGRDLSCMPVLLSCCVGVDRWLSWVSLPRGARSSPVAQQPWRRLLSSP